VRHPQYIGFVAIMFGFLLQWPALLMLLMLLTLVMFPVMVVMYVRLAKAEEKASEKAFGDAWREYPAVTSRFIPNFSKSHRARPAGSH
jgi:protein-S-isoprenylcysteine O-methyltransferase Ste14